MTDEYSLTNRDAYIGDSAMAKSQARCFLSSFRCNSLPLCERMRDEWYVTLNMSVAAGARAVREIVR